MAEDKTNKSSLELRRQIRKQEAQRKKQETAQSKEKPVVVTVITGEEGQKKISFDQWWMIINRKVAIKNWMKEIIFADMKARGLSKSETEEKYNEALKLFGISW